MTDSAEANLLDLIKVAMEELQELYVPGAEAVCIYDNARVALEAVLADHVILRKDAIDQDPDATGGWRLIPDSEVRTLRKAMDALLAVSKLVPVNAMPLPPAAGPPLPRTDEPAVHPVLLWSTVRNEIIGVLDPEPDAPA